MRVRASYMKLTRGTDLMQQFIYYYKYYFDVCVSVHHIWNWREVPTWCNNLFIIINISLMYACPCIIYEIDERYPLDATIYLLL